MTFFCLFIMNTSSLSEPASEPALPISLATIRSPLHSSNFSYAFSTIDKSDILYSALNATKNISFLVICLIRSTIFLVGTRDNDNRSVLLSILLDLFSSGPKSVTAAAKIAISYVFDDSSEMTILHISSVVVALMTLRSDESDE